MRHLSACCIRHELLVRNDDFKDISDEEMATWMDEERVRVIDVEDEDEDDTTAKKTNKENDDEEPEIA